MSAFIVSDYHINALVSWAARNTTRYYTKAFGWVGINDGTAQTIASTLLRENARSVNHRYGKRSRPRITFQMVDTGHLSHADVIRACDCLDYQSCEHDGWERSEAYAILQAIRNRAVDGLSHCSRVWELREPVEAAA